MVAILVPAGEFVAPQYYLVKNKKLERRVTR